jgi:hypothetical protein
MRPVVGGISPVTILTVVDFPGPIRAEVAEDLSGLYGKADVADRRQRPVAFCDAADFQHAALDTEIVMRAGDGVQSGKQRFFTTEAAELAETILGSAYFVKAGWLSYLC